MAGQGCRVTWGGSWGGVYCWPGPSGFARAVHVPRRTDPLPGNHRPVEAGPPAPGALPAAIPLSGNPKRVPKAAKGPRKSSISGNRRAFR
jgi:hypothetical protein